MRTTNDDKYPATGPAAPGEFVVAGTSMTGRRALRGERHA
jgi:hypothetical protein